MGLPLPRLFESSRTAIASNIAKTLEGGGDSTALLREPVGDPGFFGPGSSTWTVHSDFPSMMVGGLAALMLQTLHPGAMAGVADHSNYREDPLGRLQRTGAFVAVTTFGSTVEARRAIEIVRRVHAPVVGVTPEGRPYSANDPDLLTWVHTAEAACFLRSYRRFGPRALSRAEIDRYFTEMSVVAYELGATFVPESWDAVRAYFRAVRPELGAGAQALDGIDFIVNTRSDEPVEEGVRSLLIQAAIGVVPPWARALLGLRAPGELEGVAVDTAMRAIASVVRWAIGPSEVVAVATQRAAGQVRTAA